MGALTFFNEIVGDDVGFAALDDTRGGEAGRDANRAEEDLVVQDFSEDDPDATPGKGTIQKVVPEVTEDARGKSK